MNILVTGGYGFLGSFVAERLNKEGHKVFIIDNLSSGNKNNINFKHKFYEMDVKDQRCSDIFRINHIDALIHLAAEAYEYSSNDKLYEDTSTNVLGLINMLELSLKHKLKRFVFVSSAFVYGDAENFPSKETDRVKPNSPYAVSKLLCEEYCRIFNENHGLSTISLRVSDIYGPRQMTTIANGIVSQIIKTTVLSHKVQVFGDGNNTRDFIYVEDVADAIYRCLESDYCGCLNISTKRETSVNQVIDIIKNNTEVNNIEYFSPHKGELPRICLDNTRAIRELDWVPIYNIEEGIAKTFRWYSSALKVVQTNDNNKEIKKAQARKKIKKLLKQILPLFENFLMFAILYLIETNFKLFGEFYFIDLKLVYIILVGIVYGTRHSIIAVALSTLLYVINNYNAGRDLISLIYDSNSLMQIAFYLFIGFIVGYSIDIRNRIVNTNINKFDNLQKKFDFLHEVYLETKSVKDELQKQIRMSEDSLSKVYTLFEEINSLDSDKIYTSAIGVLERIMKSPAIAIYTVSKNGLFLRLSAASGSLLNKISKSINIKETPEFEEVINTKNIFVNKKLIQELPMLMAPVEYGNKVIGIIAIYKVEFDNMNLYYQNLLMVVANFISSSLSKAILYQEATLSERYIDGTNILNKTSFEKVLNDKIEASKENHSSYVLLEVEMEGDISEADKKITGAIREQDFIGIGTGDNLMILLTNTNPQEAQIALKRLVDRGIRSAINGYGG